MASKNRKAKTSATKPKASVPTKDFSLEDMKDEELEAMEKEGSFAWQILKKSQIKELKKMTPESVMEKLSHTMGLKNWQSDWGTGALLDCYVLSFYWCVQKSFDYRQTSAVFTLISRMLNSIRDGSSLFELTNYLADTLRGVSVPSVLGADPAVQNEGENGPAFTSPLDCISAEQAKGVTEFISDTILQHFQLYSFVFSETQSEELTSTEYCIQTLPGCNLPFPVPLEESVTEDVYNRYLMTPPVSPETEPVDAQSVNEEDAQSTSRTTESAHLKDTTEKEDEILTELTVDQIRSIVNKLAAQQIGSFQEDYHNKLKEREGAYLQRITKLAKNVEV